MLNTPKGEHYPFDCPQEKPRFRCYEHVARPWLPLRLDDRHWQGGSLQVFFEQQLMMAIWNGYSAHATGEPRRRLQSVEVVWVE